ncbi:glutaredoxin 3 [Paracoccus sp. M683]|uniref:glutaredoxin 3 n=1 Tax=Paracoccus sp. M683 TaxID=2594268 RepID=UPI00117ED3A7|nr:glutaredoxin 3 [Paracoccus sp. M683]TRW99238.1 glutaredoxin 3 [Paracoccus sp. M683]
MAHVEIYTTPTCPFCQRAKALLREKQVSFDEIDVSNQPELRAAMTQRAEGRRTVPQIFINGLPIGGNDDLQALERAGRLDALLATEADAASDR